MKYEKHMLDPSGSRRTDACGNCGTPFWDEGVLCSLSNKVTQILVYESDQVNERPVFASLALVQLLSASVSMVELMWLNHSV